MSDTPMTDAKAFDCKSPMNVVWEYPREDGHYCHADHARRLERALNEAEKALRNIRDGYVPDTTAEENLLSLMDMAANAADAIAKLKEEK